MVYQKIILIGQATIALNILKNLLEYRHFICVISYKPHNLCILKTFCQSNKLSYQSYEDSAPLSEFLYSLNSKTLIISANNNYIFPNNILSKTNLKIINFHNALLPLHKGVNAPIWSIYNQEKTTGITWHLVSCELDSGDIIIQKEIPLSPDINSFKLIQLLMELGLEAFLEIKQDLLNDTLSSTPMPKSLLNPHKSNDLPNSGFLEIEWEKEKISAFLRSMDSGGIMPKPKIHLCKMEYFIIKYSIDKPISGSILLSKNNIHMLLGGGGAR
ncbi:hypothetical protein BKH41_04315 [Helicobacter sp. 12S02232-10]|uniref:formyltransferase family protein n=1 Tax=Helicobacter sp. 12S02232-10 TaxID=1476197 RepID=UPI000BA5DA59|nr:formyltransferase family protein [Helicobacter sp. 12S02232-10]PAF48859.1 hypothetical protein BKH41_04315 [Helicobacter sp. 12S02232-10]